MACENEAFRICSNVSEALSYMPCLLQYTEPNTQYDLWVFWSQHKDEFLTLFPTNTTIGRPLLDALMKIDLRKAYDMVQWEFIQEVLEGYGFPDKFIQLIMACAAKTTVCHDIIKDQMASALENAYISDYYGCWLVQFWAPVTTNDQIFLTTCDLPFGLTKLHEGLCLYRSECLKFRIPVVTDNSENENQLGPPGRVFKHGLPEMSPDVSLYSATDYPLHGSALTAGLGNYLAVPVFQPLSNQCTGVLEIIGNKKGSFSQELVQMVYEMLKKGDLRSSNMYGHPDKKGLKGLECALKEMEEQLNSLCRTHQLPLAQTWLPILDGSSTERFMTTKEQFCICTSAGYEFRAACDMFHLKKSQGVVGRAFLSRSSCFCRDITQLRMSEYPLAHVAYRAGLRSSFAICLQSSYTGDYVYLLEFFLPQDNKSDCRCPQTMLNMLLVSMKRQFRSFKLASGQNLGEKLYVEVIDIPSDDGPNSFEICGSAKSSSDIEAVAYPEKIVWFDPLTRLLNRGNTVNLCPENIDVTTSSTTAYPTTKVTNVRVRSNRVVEEEGSMMKISKGQYRINSIVLEQSVGAEVSSSTETILASQSAPNSLGTEHVDIIDMNCSSNQLESAKGADRHFEETSGGYQSCHYTTTSLTYATRPTKQAAIVQEESTVPREQLYFLHSSFPADELERPATLREYEELQVLSRNRLLSINESTQRYLNVEAENCMLRAHLIELTERLQSLNEILAFILNSSAARIDNTEVNGKDDFLHDMER